MKGLRQTILAALALMTAACGGANLTCDEPQLYQEAVEGRRVTAPEDLDNLQAGREIPIPRASPRDPRPAGSPCLELPPTLSVGGGSDDEEEGEAEAEAQGEEGTEAAPDETSDND